MVRHACRIIGAGDQPPFACATIGGMRLRKKRWNFGCDYCRDDQNRFYGHVTQIASDEARRMILLQCPKCDALYENAPAGRDKTRRLTEDEARQLFSAFR